MNALKLVALLLLIVVVLVSSTISAQTLNVRQRDAKTSSDTSTTVTSNDDNNNGFCSRVSMSTQFCPDPPTINRMDMKKLIGTYYQVGSTASFKLRNEMGVTCSRTNFSYSPQPTTPSDDVVINIENSAIPVLQPNSPTTMALAKIAASTTTICRSAALLCNAGPLSATLIQLSTIINKLPTQHSILSQAYSTIQSAISNINQHIDSLVRSAEEIARTISTISQSASSTSTLYPLLQSLRSTSFDAAAQVRNISGPTVANLTSARNSIIQLIDVLSDSDMVDVLIDAANTLKVEIATVISEFSNAEQMLSTIGEPLPDIIAADSGDPISESDILSRVVISSGEAVAQNTDEAGNFTLLLTQMFNESSDSTGTDNMGDPIVIDDTMIMPYKIIGLGANGDSAYESILVYSCVPDPEGGPLPLSDLVLLSRTPSLPLRSILGLLDIANRYGISTDCASIFVPTLQTISDSNGHAFTCNT